MNQLHIQLIITYLPIFGSILGGLVLNEGIWTKSNKTKIAAYNIFIFSAICSGIAYLTGESTEETVKNIQGVVDTSISLPQKFALFSLISIIILGVISFLSLLLTLRKSPSTRAVAFIILFISLVSFALVARTGYLGRQIRYSKINSTINLNPTNTLNKVTMTKSVK
jgi:uncharacterized membrane protein